MARNEPERAIGEAPGQWQGPRRPQLGPHAVARPHVGLRLVADAGPRGEEGSDGRRAGRGPATEAEQSRAPIDGQRPQGEQQVQGPAKDRVGVRHRADRPGGHGRQALVVQELGRAQSEVGEPAREGEVTLLDAAGRETHHLLVQRAVVEVGHRRQLGSQFDQSPDAGDGHDAPGTEPGEDPSLRRSGLGFGLDRCRSFGRGCGRAHAGIDSGRGRCTAP